MEEDYCPRVRIWRGDDAPEELRKLVSGISDSTWLIEVPGSYGDMVDSLVLQWRTAYDSVTCRHRNDGWLVVVAGQHKNASGESTSPPGGSVDPTLE